MTTETIYSGYWWLPQAAGLRLPGTLSRSKRDGVSLALSGHFPSELVFNPLGVIILGEDSFGKPITLYQAFLTQSEYPGADPAKGTSSYLANIAFLGCHFASIEDARFEEMSYRPSHLDDWFHLGGLSLELQDRGFTAVYARPEQVVVASDDKLKILLGFEEVGPSIGGAMGHMSFEQHALFRIRAVRQEHLDFFLGVMDHIDRFLSLATMAPVVPLSMKARASMSAEDGLSSREIELLVAPYDADERPINFFEMLVSYADVSSRLFPIMNKWLSLQTSLEPVLDLFFAVTCNPGASGIQTFLNYVQALETYHIRIGSKEIDPPDLHAARMEEIIRAAPERHRAWLKEHLAFSNSPTLAIRLRELIERMPELVCSMVGDREIFIRDVKRTRNYYTHYDPARQEEAKTGGELVGLSRVLGSMLEAILLMEVGLSLEEIRDKQRHRRKLPRAWY